ncbi:hypothetical protein BZK42_24080 [Citrobacter braakii]|uniref:Uncharacterized protein n=1 Tax=Citrobacter braakii TaxID=57706 RepID=A0A1V8NT28_CITBR|nr:hypothetical protein BZK42_24080 [Citrobacter braakii]
MHIPNKVTFPAQQFLTQSKIYLSDILCGLQVKPHLWDLLAEGLSSVEPVAWEKGCVPETS